MYNISKEEGGYAINAENLTADIDKHFKKLYDKNPANFTLA
ncbi:hypothetical protein KIS1582_3814 [Cytobacillus firmus]|uniref:Uncharacterized protein n=1 Tax=Cytobacillus firmus TaxID=1399 RepID=A0A800MTV3_CYTFI|nr:hypothetical protein KIS1582_3814 [Cytobacillus firmus]